MGHRKTWVHYFKNSDGLFDVNKGPRLFSLKPTFDYIILPGFQETIRTNLCIGFPLGSRGRIIELDHPNPNLILQTGVLHNYYGVIAVKLINIGDQNITVPRGVPIAELVCEKGDLFTPEFMEGTSNEDPVESDKNEPNKRIKTDFLVGLSEDEETALAVLTNFQCQEILVLT
jgi:dUTPase